MTENIEHQEYIEDALEIQLPLDDKTPLSDNELRENGLVKTSAFVRTKKSKNALRVQKHKEKKADDGIKQLNVEVPIQYRDQFKAFAKRLVAGESFESAAKQATSDHKDSVPEQAQKQSESVKSNLSNESIEIGNKCAQIVEKGGFKSWLLKKIV